MDAVDERQRNLHQLGDRRVPVRLEQLEQRQQLYRESCLAGVTLQRHEPGRMSGQLLRLEQSFRQCNLHRGQHRRHADAVSVRRLEYLVDRWKLQRSASVNGSPLHDCRGVPDGVDGLEPHRQLHGGADDTVSDGLDCI
ncbi:MAG: hypothetical protein AW07_02110 [Candidatus Accumulibacter sp. SK-11]|nr:MAG: hypothetical protein AW07_02110 [Candidatus Accumulibacter sp. SK-11]